MENGEVRVEQNVKLVRSATTACAAGLAVSSVACVLSHGALSVVFAISTVALLVVLLLGIRRIQMAKFPQLVADDSGLTMASLFGVRHIGWDEITRIGPLVYPGVSGYTRQKKRPRFLLGVPDTTQFGQFFVHAGAKTYMVNEPSSGPGQSFVAVRDQVEQMRQQRSRGGASAKGT